MHVHVIPNEGESMRPNENSKNPSGFTYQKKDAYTETSLYGRLLNALNNLDTLYKPTM